MTNDISSGAADSTPGLRLRRTDGLVLTPTPTILYGRRNRTRRRARRRNLFDREVQFLSCDRAALLLSSLVYDGHLESVVAGFKFSERQSAAAQDSFWRRAAFERLDRS